MQTAVLLLSFVFTAEAFTRDHLANRVCLNFEIERWSPINIWIVNVRGKNGIPTTMGV